MLLHKITMPLLLDLVELINHLLKISSKQEVQLCQLPAQVYFHQAVQCVVNPQDLARVKMNGQRRVSKFLINRLMPTIHSRVGNLVKVEL